MCIILLRTTVKLGIKEMLNKEQTGFREFFSDYHKSMYWKFPPKRITNIAYHRKISFLNPPLYLNMYIQSFLIPFPHLLLKIKSL